MTIPIRRSGLAGRRPFSLRQTAVLFGLLALVLCGAGLTLKLIVGAVHEQPATGAAVAVVVLAAVAGLRRARRRRAGRRISDTVVEATHQIIETHAAEAGRAQPLTARQAPAELPAHEAAAVGLADTGEVYAAGAERETFAATDYAAMDPVGFEQAIAALCERDGCEDVEVVGGAGDLGADVLATTPDGRRVVIQCKRYGPVNKVGSQEVQRFGGTCFAVHEAHVAAVVTTGEFTQPAADYAEQCGIGCVDHERLVAWTDGTGPAPWDEAS
ncbi:restriction endonuclease [Streptomyces sp. NPDC005283]|uniref:restriction endonuclease n=1 Tax=Streptomyces sp. NPDC005283 TaxID=3156871 RepID=UPI0034550BB9